MSWLRYAGSGQDGGGWRGRWRGRVLTLAAALTIVALAVWTGSGPATEPAAREPARSTAAATGAAAAGPRAGPPARAARPSKPAPATVLVRSVGDLPPAVVPRVRAIPGMAAVAVVRSGTVYLTGSDDGRGRPVDAPPPGWALPLDVAGIDPKAYAALLPADRRGPVASLRPGHALLGSTAARLRGLGPGAVLALGGTRLRVAGAVDDGLVGGAELIVGAGDAAELGVEGASYVLAGAADIAAGAEGAPDVSALRRRVGAALAGVHGVLVRDLGRAPWPVSWREVLPQALVKDRFGEFPVRLDRGRAVELAPGWVRDHIVTGAVPLLGGVRCHRTMLPALRGALAELERTGLGRLVDPGDFAGCFSPRLIAAGAPVSRHAWGIAVDLNASRNPNGSPSRQDPRLVEVMERHGFAFGGRWPIPDAMHFEYRGR